MRDYRYEIRVALMALDEDTLREEIGRILESMEDDAEAIPVPSRGADLQPADDEATHPYCAPSTGGYAVGDVIGGHKQSVWFVAASVPKYKEPFDTTHYVNPGSTGEHPNVKTAEYFEASGGFVDPWGESWVPVRAEGPHHARLLAWAIGKGYELPTGISFPAFNTRTVKELKR